MKRSLISQVSLVLTLALLPQVAEAQTATWDGGGTDNNFSTGDNWVSNTAPNAATATAYTFSGTTRLTPYIQSNNYLMSSLTFDASAGAFTIGPAGVLAPQRFQAASTTTSITQNSASNQIVNATIYMPSYSSTNTLAVGGTGAGTLTLSSLRFATNSNYSIDLNHDVILDLASWVTDSPGTGGITIRALTASRVTFLGTTYQGLSSLFVSNAATLEAANASGFSTTATLDVSQNLTFTGAGSMAITGNVTQYGNAAKTHTFETDTTLASSGKTIQLGAENGTGSRTTTLDVDAGVTAELAGNVTGSASTGTTSLTKTGTGTLLLSGGADYNGITQVSAGTLQVDGNNAAATGNVIVDSGATLSGMGTLGGAVSISGTLAPGVGGSTETLTVNNTVSFQPGAVAMFDIDGTSAGSFDRLVSTSILALDGDLTLDMGFALSGDSNWDLFDFMSQTGGWDSVTLSGNYVGAFTSIGDLWTLSDVGGYDWSFDETTGILSAIAVPEPSAMSTFMLTLGSLFFLCWYRKGARSAIA